MTDEKITVYVSPTPIWPCVNKSKLQLCDYLIN